MELSRVSVIGNQCAFKGIREDLKSVSELSNNDKPLSENKKRNILAALNNVAKVPSDDNLALLLATAQGLKYGVKRNSKFAEIIDVSTTTPKENTRWDEILDNTIKNAIESSDSSKKEGFFAEYDRIFKQERPLTKEEIDVVKLRSQILSSKEMKNVIEDSEKLLHSAKIAKNLDYFLASSEISMTEKRECLKKMNHFLSNDYQIDEQLKDKKLQALSEMINDMIIKTPANPALKIKEVNQRQTGMCAAISICRKAIAYEYKANYMDIVMSELDNKPIMQVYDVTNLESQKKVPAKKTYVDYNDALRKGYRIIDASAHQWMHLAGSVGNGAVSSKSYTPFDSENYEIFRDSTWYRDLPAEYKPAQSLLRLLVKEQRAIEKISKSKEDLTKLQTKIGDHKNTYLDIISKSDDVILNSVKSLSSEITPTQARMITRGILNLQKTKEVDLKINLNEGGELKKKKIAEYIKSQVKNVSDEKISAKIDSIYNMYKQSVESSGALAKLNRHNKPRSKYSQYKDLFELAAIHRKAIEADVNLPGTVSLYEQSLGLSPAEQQVEQHIEKLKNSLNSPSSMNKIAKGLNVVPNKTDIESALNQKMTAVQVEIPRNIDDVLQRMSMGNRAKVLQSFVNSLKNSIQAGDETVMSHFAQNVQIKSEKHIVLKKIDSYLNELSASPSNKQISEITRALGYEDQVGLLMSMYDTYTKALANGVDEQVMVNLSGNLGNPLSMKKAVQKLSVEINAIAKQYDDLQDQLNVPYRKDVVLKKLEEKKEILPEATINQLYNRFDKIYDETVRREKLKEQGTEIKDDSIYKFTKEEMNIFGGIEDEFPKIKKYANAQYKMMNAYLEPQLTKLYGETGKAIGHFWISEEGHSGLFDNQSVRISEQMTGKPYYIETDILKAAEIVKKGNGSGTSTTSVLDSEYALHAQYVPEISSVEMVDPKTKQKVVKDVLWHDNSWGKAENEGKWLGDEGLYHTDYKNGYGGDGGYIFGEDFKTGTLVSDLNSKYGILKDEDEERFPICFNMVLPGVSPETYSKINDTFSYIFDVGDSKTQLDAFEAKINAGEKVNIKELEGIDDRMSAASEKYSKRVEKELTSQEKYDKLPENDLLKFLLEKLAIYKSASSYEIKNKVIEVMNRSEMDELKAEIKETQKGYFDDVFNKSPQTLRYVANFANSDVKEVLSIFESKYKVDFGDKKEFVKELFNVPESDIDGSFSQLGGALSANISKVVASKVQNKQIAEKLTGDLDYIVKMTLDTDIAINSLANLHEGNEEVADAVVKWIDKKFNARTDADVIAAVKKMQQMTKAEFAALTADMTEEDLGIKYENPYNNVVKLNAQNESTKKAFDDIVNTHIVLDSLPEAHGVKNSYKKEDASIGSLYRELYVAFSNIDVDKYIKKFKAQAFDKYQVRSAFPQISVISDKNLEKCVEDNLKMLMDGISLITGQNYILNVLKKADEAQKSIGAGTELDKEESYNKFSSQIKELYSLTQKDASLESVNKNLEAIIKSLDSGYGNFNTSNVTESFQDVMSYFDNLKSSWPSIEGMESGSETTSKEINEHIDLFVKSNVLPRYQNDARQLVNKWIKAFGEAPDSSKELAAYKSIIDMVVKSHMTKDPSELLHSYVNELQSKNKNEGVASVLRHYMEATVEAAQLVNVEYRLVKNQNKGIASKTRDMMDLFFVNLDDKSYPLNTDEGISYLLGKLANENNDNSTLKLFFSQTGLSERAIEVLMKNFSVPTALKYIMDTEKTIISLLENTSHLEDSYDEFLKNNNVKYSSYSDASKHLLSVLEKSYANKSTNDKVVYEVYKSYFEQASTLDSCKTTNPSLILPVLNQIHLGAIEYLDKKRDASIYELTDTNDFIKEKEKVVMSLEIADKSFVNKERKNFIDSLERLRAQQQSSIGRINEVVENLDSKNAE